MSFQFRRVAASILLAAALLAQEPDTPTFGTTTKLVVVPFNVQRGKYFAADLQRSDFILREDGHPREFTVFEGPDTPHPLPLEFVLLFDTSKLPAKSPHKTITSVWDAKADYEFLDNWDESITRTVLDKNGMDVRLSVYHFDDGHLERLCRATRDPREITQAFRRLLDPIPATSALTLLPGDHLNQSYFILFSTGWWHEATVATFQDVAASPVAARRVLLLFSDLWAGGTSGAAWQSIGDKVLASGTEIDPVILDLYKMAATRHITGDNGRAGLPGSSIPVEMADHSTRWVSAPVSGELGPMTGGETLIPEHLNRDALANILLRIRDTTLSKYLVGFVPEASAKPGKHRLEVELKSKTAGKVVGGERDGVVY
jgi:hypothetical protein